MQARFKNKNADDLFLKSRNRSPIITQVVANPNDCWTVDTYEYTIPGDCRQSIPSKRTKQSQEVRMPVTTSSQSLLASLPSFMSVFGDGRGTRDEQKDSITSSHATSRSSVIANGRPSHNNPLPSYIFRRKSSSTFQSESTDSSPTTTISTLDSSLTEPSPSSSPESPTSSQPLSSFNSITTLSRTAKPATMDDDNPPPSPLPNLPGQNRAESPNKKMRNTKNLSLNTLASHKSSLPLPRLATSSNASAVPTHASSTPASPSFLVPMKPPKRKPSNLGLTITTAETTVTGQLAQSAPSLIPQTPFQARPSALKHFETMTNLPLFSPTVAPEGGMQFPPLGNSSTTGRFPIVRPPLSLSQQSSYDSIHSSPTTVQTLEHVPEESGYEPPLSREIKSPAYPQGPVCIYDPHVYLYLEPDHTEALKFDVIINVAREVLNPFTEAAEKMDGYHTKDAGMQVDLDLRVSGLATVSSVSEPPSAVSENSFLSAFERVPQPSSDAPLEISEKAQLPPEYIHIPWDHNTNVVDDLLRLCETIDNRVQQGKRVLVHCQCGVSRSASLIVAYGLYKNPQLTVQEAYDAVKERSKWIGPNMHLIYQLAEFRTILARNIPPQASNWRSKRNTGPIRANTDSLLTQDLGSSLPSSSSAVSQREPSTAPLRDDQEAELQRASSLSPPLTAQMATVSSNGHVSPGPSSAPPSMQWSPMGASPELRHESKGQDVQVQLPPPMSPTSHMDVDAASVPASSSITAHEAPKLEPSHQLSQSSPASGHPLPGGFSSMSVRRQAPRPLPLRQEAPHFINIQSTQIGLDQVMTDGVPETPSLLSPRAAEFTTSPFHRTAAGDLAGSSVFEQALMSPRIQDTDPRSPPQKGEAPITRSIDDVLD